jgi:hypothetical protein
MNSHSVKTKFIKLGVLIMAAVTLAGMSGCFQKKPDVSRQAEQMLEAKYHEKFTVSKVYGGSLVPTNIFADTYKLICSPENNPNLKFEAQLSPNGVFCDNYVSAIVNAKIEKMLSDALHKEFSNVAIKSIGVGDFDYNTESTNKDITMEQYFDENRNGLLIYILIQTDKTKAGDIYDILQSTMKSVKNFTAAIYCFCVNQTDFISGQKVFENSMDIEPKDFEKQYKSMEDAGVGFLNNTMNKTREEFIAEFDKLGKWN